MRSSSDGHTFTLSTLLLVFLVACATVATAKKQHFRILVSTVPTMVRSEYEPFLLIARALANAAHYPDFDFSIYFSSSTNLKDLVTVSGNDSSSSSSIQFVSYGISADQVSNATASIYSLIQSQINKATTTTTTTSSGTTTTTTGYNYNAGSLLYESQLWNSQLYLRYYETAFKSMRKLFMKLATDSTNRLPFDIVIVHPAALAVRDLAAMFGIPAICIPTSLASLPNQPYYVPHGGSGLGVESTLWQRLKVVLGMLFTANSNNQDEQQASTAAAPSNKGNNDATSQQSTMEAVKQTRKRVMTEDSDALQMLENSPPLSLILYPTYYQVEYTFPVDPFIKYVGPIIEKPQIVVATTREQQTSYDVILHFGNTCVKFDDSVYRELNTALEAMVKQKYTVAILLPSALQCTNGHQQQLVESMQSLFSASTATILIVSNQQEEHQYIHNAKVVVTYGDFPTVHLALYHAVPVLLIPLHFDQFDIAARIREKKLGLVLNFNELDTLKSSEFGSGMAISEMFKHYMTRLIAIHTSGSNSHKYSSGNSIAKAVTSASTAFRHVVRGLDKVIENVHDTLVMGNNEHLIPTWYSLPSYRIYNLDILAICFGLPSLFTLIFFCIFGYKYLASSGYLDKLKKD